MEHFVLVLVTIALYLAAGIGFSLGLIRPSSKSRYRALVLGLGITAVMAHGVLLYGNALAPGGLNMSFFNAASVIAWLMAALVLSASFGQPVENLNIAILPLAAVSVALNAAFSPPGIVLNRLPAGLEIHILVSILAYSLLSIAVLQALVLAVQDRQIRNKHPGGIIRALPPLQTMEKLLFRMLWLGFIGLSLSLVTGFVFIEDIFAQHLVHKTVLSIVAWVVFATLLWGRWRYGWRGRVAIRWTLGGFIALMLAYFGTKLVLEFILHRSV